MDFGCPDRGAVEETFCPWVLTCQRFKDEGMPAEIALGAHDITNDLVGKNANADPEKYLPVTWGEGVMAYENYFGFDPVRRIHFVLPFRRFEEYVAEETPEHTIRQDIFGRRNIQKRGSAIELPYRPIDAEFARILPVVRQGGYIVGADHQVPPSASLENYKYYIARLREVMAHCGQV